MSIPTTPRPRRLPAVVLAAGLLILAACQPIGQQEASTAQSGDTGGTQRLSIATGGTGGVYFPLGGGLADLITENIPSSVSEKSPSTIRPIWPIDEYATTARMSRARNASSEP